VAIRHPARFASLSSVCGRCLTPEALPALANLPVWIAYAEDDEIAELTQGSKNAAQQLAPYGHLEQRPYRLGRQGGLGPHVRTCDAAYAEPWLYRWMISPGRLTVDLA
jgi:predicted peptidase